MNRVVLWVYHPNCSDPVGHRQAVHVRVRAHRLAVAFAKEKRKIRNVFRGDVFFLIGSDLDEDLPSLELRLSPVSEKCSYLALVYSGWTRSPVNRQHLQVLE
jgi:hypothetical protein